jgi:hypothetical protein
MNRVLLAGVCAIAAFLLGLVSNHSLVGQQVVPPGGGKVGRYQLSAAATQHAIALYFLDTETGQLWFGSQGIDHKTVWHEIGSPVRPVPMKK